MTENKPRRARLGMLFWIAVMLLTVALDQYTKHLARTLLAPVGDVPLWDGVLHLTYVENTGAAFGMMKNQRWIFLLLSMVAIIVLSVYAVVERKKLGEMGGISLALIVGGGIGNMIERIGAGYVTDFVNFKLIGFAVFNYADAAVCVGAALLMIYVLFFADRTPHDGGAADGAEKKTDGENG